MRRVQVRLEVIKTMKVPSTRCLLVRPGCLLYPRKDHPLICVRGLPFTPYIPVAIFRTQVGACVPEPGMLIRSVVNNQIDNYSHAALRAPVRELDKIAQCSVTRINGI